MEYYYKSLSFESIVYLNVEGMKCIEQWRDVPEYDGVYQVSDLGRVKSLDRKVVRGSGFLTIHRCVFKQGKGKRGYLVVSLKKGNANKSLTVHKLVAMAFLNHIPCGYEVVVDHVDNDKLNNKLSNLQLITQRGNCSKDKKGTSVHPGVHYVKRNNGWAAKIRIKGKRISLYCGSDELLARDFYIKAVENVDKYNGNVEDFKKELGIKSNKSKLTINQVLVIRRLASINPNFDRVKVCAKLKISYGAIYDIIIRKNWKHI